MKTIILFFITLLLLSGLIGVASYWSTLETAEQRSDDAQTKEISSIDTSQWLAVLKQVNAYYVPPKETDETSDGASSLAQAKSVKLTDGQLVGIVAGSPAKVYVIAANETEPDVLLVGEGWLAPWIVATVYKDRVVWRNTQNDETITQYLFDES